MAAATHMPVIGTPGVSIYEREREKNIAANRAVLASLGLLEDVTSLKQSMESQRTEKQRPKVKKSWPSERVRKASGRSEKLEKIAAKEAKIEAKRRAAEEEVLEEKREAARLVRKQRLAIQKREEAKEAKRKAKLEQERKARQQVLAEQRRARDAEMRELRAQRAEAAREMRREAKQQRDAEVALAVDRMRDRKANLRHATESSVENAVAGFAVRRSASQRAANQRKRDERFRSSVGETEEFHVIYEGMCDAPGCCFKEHHLGPCSTALVKEGQRRRAAESVSYVEQSDADFTKEHNLKSTVWEASPKKDKVKDRSQPIAARSMLRAGHPYIGRRVARLFGRRLVLGTVTGFLPACKIQGVGALFRVTHDDGDEEDLEEDEAAEAGDDYSSLAPRESRWLSVGHPHIGARVTRRFDGAKVYGTVRKWLPADEAEGEPALYRIVHDDGDQEELEEDEVEAAVADFLADAPVEVTNELWRTEGHELIGLRLVREFDGAGEELATITQWLAADEASGEPALFRAVHDDGDEEDLEEDEAREAIDEFNLRAMENEDWRTDGHPFLQKRALRTFGGGGSKRKLKTALGTVTKWLAAEGCEPALFRVVHDDGGKRARSHASTHTALSPPCSL